MSWGTFEKYDTNGRIEEIHIVPCTKEGKPYAGHTVSCFCECCPELEEVAPGKPPLYHHHQLH
jgi:hypothetical protein